MIDANRLLTQSVIVLLIIPLAFTVHTKLFIVIGFPGINSAVQLSTVGYSFLVFGMKIEGVKKIKNVFIACSSMKGSQSIAKTQFLTNIVNKYCRMAYISAFRAFADGGHRFIRRPVRSNHSSLYYLIRAKGVYLQTVHT